MNGSMWCCGCCSGSGRVIPGIGGNGNKLGSQPNPWGCIGCSSGGGRVGGMRLRGLESCIGSMRLGGLESCIGSMRLGGLGCIFSSSTSRFGGGTGGFGGAFTPSHRKAVTPDEGGGGTGKLLIPEDRGRRGGWATHIAFGMTSSSVSCFSWGSGWTLSGSGWTLLRFRG